MANWTDNPRFPLTQFLQNQSKETIKEHLHKIRLIMMEENLQYPDDPSTVRDESYFKGLSILEENLRNLRFTVYDEILDDGFRGIIESIHSVNRYFNSSWYPTASNLASHFSKFQYLFNIEMVGKAKDLQYNLSGVVENLKLEGVSDKGNLKDTLPAIFEKILEKYTACPFDDLEPCSIICTAAILKHFKIPGSRPLAGKVASYYKSKKLTTDDWRTLKVPQIDDPEFNFVPPGGWENPVDLKPSPGDVYIPPIPDTTQKGHPIAPNKMWHLASFAVAMMVAIVMFMWCLKRLEYRLNSLLLVAIYIYGTNELWSASSSSNIPRGLSGKDYNISISWYETEHKYIEEDIFEESKELEGGYRFMFGVAISPSGSPIKGFDLKENLELEPNNIKQIVEECNKRMGLKKIGLVWMEDFQEDEIIINNEEGITDIE